jgi:hypothetical protein
MWVSKGVLVGIPYAAMTSAGARFLAGALNRAAAPPPSWARPMSVGLQLNDLGTVAWIVTARDAAAGFGRDVLSGHDLRRGAFNTAKDRRAHPTQAARPACQLRHPGRLY